MPMAYNYKTVHSTAAPLTPEELEAARRARNEYQREWRRRNPEKVRAAQKRYWLRKAAQQTGKGKTT